MTARYESSDPDTFHRTLDRALHPSPADTLLKAAALLRERAEAARDGRPEWFAEVDGWDERTIWTRRDAWDYAPQPVLSEHTLRKTPGAFEHFAAMTPDVALAAAGWLEEEAAAWDFTGWPQSNCALTFAQTYLGSVTP